MKHYMFGCLLLAVVLCTFLFYTPTDAAPIPGSSVQTQTIRIVIKNRRYFFFPHEVICPTQPLRCVVLTNTSTYTVTLWLDGTYPLVFRPFTSLQLRFQMQGIHYLTLFKFGTIHLILLHVQNSMQIAANPWNYRFTGTILLRHPNIAFCTRFLCVTTFWKDQRGYVVQCRNGKYSHSGGIPGACSQDLGVMNTVYQQ